LEPVGITQFFVVPLEFNLYEEVYVVFTKVPKFIPFRASHLLAKNEVSKYGLMFSGLSVYTITVSERFLISLSSGLMDVVANAPCFIKVDVEVDVVDDVEEVVDILNVLLVVISRHFSKSVTIVPSKHWYSLTVIVSFEPIHPLINTINKKIAILFFIL